MDAVQQANSGHPGAPMGMADIAVALWGRHLRHNPANPHWADRDRFVLSQRPRLDAAVCAAAPHRLRPADRRAASDFRQLHSKTPGHPEVGVTPGVETTTGPLGQGLANAVGMALAEKLLAAEFNRAGHAIVDHHTYVFLGDGCLMEGISHEACALAGAWKLDKLIALYDDNGISIDGQVAALVHRRHAAALRGLRLERDRPDRRPRRRRRRRARSRRRSESADKPTLIVLQDARSARARPNRAGTAKAHGEALGADEIAADARARSAGRTRRSRCPHEVYARLGRQRQRAPQREAGWNDAFAAYAARLSPSWPPSSRAAWRASCRRDFARDRRRRRGRRARPRPRPWPPQGEPARARGLHRGAARNARRHRPT